MTAPAIQIVVEGATDVPVAKRVVAEAGWRWGRVVICRGKGNLDRQLAGWLRAAERGPWLVLRDMDHDAPCPGELRRRLIGRGVRWMCLRLAVRETESWLMADAEGLSRFLSAPVADIPADPDAEDDAKGALVRAASHSHRSDVRRMMVPAPHMTAKVGPLYQARIMDFAWDVWSPAAARQRSPSLDRALVALERMRTAWLRRVEGG